jgi:dihydroorotate dehydrogenase
MSGLAQRALRSVPVPVRALGLDFPGPIGLAAGFDRDGRHAGEVLAWGFGCVELGTVTPRPQAEHNPGAPALAARLTGSGILALPIGARAVLGVSLGRQPGSPVHDAAREYLAGMRALWDCADYLVLNFTAPAAGPLHAPAQQHALSALLAEAREAQERLAASVRRRVPLLVKWPIRLPDERALAHLARVRDLGYDGVVAAFDSHLERGVVSWEQQVPAACRMLAALLGPRLTLIAVGGIDKAARARALIQAGAR